MSYKSFDLCALLLILFGLFKKIKTCCQHNIFFLINSWIHQVVTNTNVSLLMEFIAWWNKISFILSTKWMGFKEVTSILKVQNLTFQSQVFPSKINPCCLKIVFYRNHWLYKQLILMIPIANFKLGGTLFSDIKLNFCRPHAMSVFKIQQFPCGSLIVLIKDQANFVPASKNFMT